MKIQSIKSHLRPYSIYQKRKTTINHAFASALAPCSEYSAAAITSALAVLGQPGEGELLCVYCGEMAKTWDHLTGLVKASELHGFGHQIGNLVPCCRDCNSRKGSKDWRTFVNSDVAEPRRSFLQHRLAEYQTRFAEPIDTVRAREKEVDTWTKYDAIRLQIHTLMQEADALAAVLRHCVRDPAE